MIALLLALGCAPPPPPPPPVFVRGGVITSERVEPVPEGRRSHWPEPEQHLLPDGRWLTETPWSPGRETQVGEEELRAPLIAECVPLFHVDLGDVSRGEVVSINNFYRLFKDILTPVQLSGLQFLLTPFPQEEFNPTDDRKTSQPSTHRPTAQAASAASRPRAPAMSTRPR